MVCVQVFDSEDLFSLKYFLELYSDIQYIHWITLEKNLAKAWWISVPTPGYVIGIENNL